MRPGRSHRADAILNSPIVRALINSRPSAASLPVKSALSAAKTTTAEMQGMTPLSPPRPSDLISTQPQASVALVPVNEGKGKKRERDDNDDASSKDDQVNVSYTVENLPPELKKCTLSRASSRPLAHWDFSSACVSLT